MDTSPKIQTANDLIEGILQGKVPHQVRQFAAQGLLPVSREDLLRIQLVLSADPDEALAALARTSLAEVPVDVFLTWLRTEEITPLDLDLLARVRHDEPLWGAVAAHPEVSDETLRILARNGPAMVQDIIITNQVRILGCLELLDDLRANPRIDRVVMRRVKEFEEEFIAKAIAAEGELEKPESGPSVESALEALKVIGAHLPAEGDLAIPESADSELAAEAARRGKDAFSRILIMNTYEKVMTGLKGTREERSILINSRNHLVVRAVLACPKLSDPEVERFASSRAVTEEVIRVIAGHPRWTRRYQVALALVQNPKTPVRAALRLIPRLNDRDLKRVAFNRNVQGPVRQQAQRIRQTRR